MNVKYQKTNNGDFFYTVNKRVENYFALNKVSKKTNAFGFFKLLFFISAFIVLYYLVLSAHGNPWQMWIAFALMGFVQICLVLNIGHEGVHGSFSDNKKLNYILAFTFDLVGTSGYLWKMRHLYSHHAYPMIPEHDVDIQQSEMFTFVPMKEPKAFYRYQKVYVPLLYCMYSLNAIFKRDWQDFFSNKIGHKSIQHSRNEVIRFVATKILYFTYALVLPLIFSGPIMMVMIGFLIMHIVVA